MCKTNRKKEYDYDTTKYPNELIRQFSEVSETEEVFIKARLEREEQFRRLQEGN